MCVCIDVDRHLPFLTGGIPDLSFNEFALKSDRTCLKLDTNGGLLVITELVLCKTWKELRFSDSRVTNHYHLEHVVDLFRQCWSTYVFILRRLSAHLFVHCWGTGSMKRKSSVKFWLPFCSSKWRVSETEKVGRKTVWANIVLWRQQRCSVHSFNTLVALNEYTMLI